MRGTDLLTGYHDDVQHAGQAAHVRVLVLGRR